MTLEDFEDAMFAIHEGRASELWDCPECNTLQGEERRARTPGTAFDFNASEAIKLRCGHWLV